MSPRPIWLNTDRREQKDQAPEERRDRRERSDRRRDNRLRLSLEVAVPVVVRGPHGVERGLARNISEGGMLIEMEDLPAINAHLEITISGVERSTDAPDSVTLTGEVRHHVAWQHTVRGKRQTMRGVGVRFVERPKETDELTTWVWSAGQTVH